MVRVEERRVRERRGSCKSEGKVIMVVRMSNEGEVRVNTGSKERGSRGSFEREELEGEVGQGMGKDEVMEM